MLGGFLDKIMFDYIDDWLEINICFYKNKRYYYLLVDWI